MTSISDSGPSTEVGSEPSVPPAPSVRADLKTVAYWLSLGAAAGGLGGLLVGGISGRIAMFILRLTSDDSVRGIESDDGFTIGRFDLLSTLNLLATTMFLGSFVGLFVVLGRPFLPSRWMPAAWGLAGAMVGGMMFINADGVDFTLLEPRVLAVGMFIVIPGVGAGLIAWLVERLHHFWWERRKTTAIVALAAVPAVVTVVIPVVALVGGAIWLLVGRIKRFRGMPQWRLARIAALVVFAAVIVVGVLGLNDKVQAVL